MKNFVLILFIGVATIKICSACCCTTGVSKDFSFGKVSYLGEKAWNFVPCGCNIFDCNCDTYDNGYCGYKAFLYDDDRKPIHEQECSPKPIPTLPNHFMEKARDKRKKRSLFEGIPALNEFKKHDINGDGNIDFEEARTSLGQKFTEIGFKTIDTDNNGLICMGEFDNDLK